MGNPPFVGQRYISEQQHKDIIFALDGWDNSGKMDYVTGWYKKAADIIQNTSIKCALVSTNSITQGEQVAYLWKPLRKQNITIDYAYTTFIWDSEANSKAHVHCVIIGFSYNNSNNKKVIYSENGKTIYCDKINGYLLNADDIYAERRKTPICDVQEMATGNRQADGGYLTLTEDEMLELISSEPQSKKYIRKMVGSEEFINNKQLYCLWLLNADPTELRNCHLVMKRVQKCREHRLAGKPDRQRLANKPTLFREQINPESAIIIPTVSSEKRRYVPMGFINKDIIVNANAQIIADATIYDFGILESNTHMAWMRAVAGRLEMRYRYSKDIVYNNFPWPTPTDEQKNSIEQTAQAILDARALYPNSSLADMYGDQMYLYPELLKAHQNNDIAVMKAYGFTKVGEDGKNHWLSESEVVAELMRMYKELTE